MSQDLINQNAVYPSLTRQLTHGPPANWPPPAVTTGRCLRSGPLPRPHHVAPTPSRPRSMDVLPDEVLVSPSPSDQTWRLSPLRTADRLTFAPALSLTGPQRRCTGGWPDARSISPRWRAPSTTPGVRSQGDGCAVEWSVSGSVPVEWRRDSPR
jgi:hypothetical protein